MTATGTRADVEVWLVSLAPVPEVEPGWWWTLLDAEEVSRAHRFHRAADRVRYVARHVALRLILADRLGVAPEAVAFAREGCPLCGEPHGRPILADRRGPAFSLTSTGDVAVVALAPVPVGVDVEAVGRVAADDLAAALSPAERAAVEGSAVPDRDTAALRCWARKEALLKGRGIGLGVDPETVHVGVGPLPRAARPDGWVIADVPVRTDLVAAVAYRSAEVRDVHVVTLDLAALGEGDGVHGSARRTSAESTATH